jgi:hypothetical protein
MQRFATPRPVRLEVNVPVADVEVATVDGDESTVTLEGSPKLVDTTKVELSGDRLVVEHQRKTFTSFFSRFDGSLHVRAHVPHHSRVEIVTASGSATLDGTFAGLELTSTSGDVRVTGELDGNASAKTVSGDVRLPRVVGDVTVRTVSGDLVAESVGSRHRSRLGLPRGHVPPGPRHADRSRARQGSGRRERPRGMGGPKGPQGFGPERPRTGDRRPG